MARNFLGKIVEELGILSLWTSTFDIKLLCLQRYVRLFAYGGSTLILVAYLDELGISKTRIGLFMTLTLVGDVMVSFILTLFADALGRKAILTLGALLMAGSGAIFALSGNYWILLMGAILGVISPSGNEIGPFRAIEESIVAQLTPSTNRSDVYAWYSLIGTAGAASGMIGTGWIIRFLRQDLGWNNLKIHHSVFWGYAIFGLIKAILALALSKQVEAEKKKVVPPSDAETAPLLGDDTQAAAAAKGNRSIVYKLCLLFALDAFASGLAPISWIVWFFHEKFGLREEKLGSLFFVTNIIAAMSMLVASSISKRFGNVKTMVFTHLPSSIFLALLPIPNSLPIAMMFLILRSCTQSMDSPPRSAFIAAVIQPHERTAVMGLFNVTKTTAMSVGPTITGLLASKKLFWAAFVAAGSLKATYDLGMLAVFASHKTKDELDEEQRRAEEDERLRESEDPVER